MFVGVHLYLPMAALRAGSKKRGQCRKIARSKSPPERKSEVAKKARRSWRHQTKWRRRQTRRAKADWWLVNLGFAVSE